MAANGSVEEKGCGGELDKILVKTKLNGIKAVLQNSVFDHAFAFDQNESVCADADQKPEEILASCLVSGCWINKNKVNVNLRQGSSAPLILCSKTDPELRRSLRRDRSGSTESVVTISGGESCQSSCAASDIASEPSSPSRPVTPQPMPPVPTQHCPYECLRADSEDSGLGPSPAKSLVNPTSPEGSVSPIQFGRCGEEEEDDRSDSLLDLSPRTDNSYESEENHCSKEYIANSPEEGVHGLDSAFRHYCLPLTDCDKPAIPKSPKLSSQSDSFQFLLSTKNCVNSNQTRAEDFRILHHSNHTMVNSSQFPSQILNSEELDKEGNSTNLLSSYFDEQACRDDLESDTFCGQQLPLNAFTKAECIKNSNGLNLTTRVSPSSTDEDHHHPHSESTSNDQLFVQKTHLNPKVVLIRSNFDNQSLYVEESNSRQSSYSEAANQGPLCNELNIDCTSSNCSQGSAVDSQNSSSVASGEDGACKWLNCNRTADANTTATDLVDHIRQCHVQSQPDDSKSYVCLWVGCKVYERPSCSRSWLERHVLLHGGSKPFRCIVDGCNQRFSSEVVLQRHVNSHFPQSRSNKGNDHANGRLCRRKRHKHRRRPQSHVDALSSQSNVLFQTCDLLNSRRSLKAGLHISGLLVANYSLAVSNRVKQICNRIDCLHQSKQTDNTPSPDNNLTANTAQTKQLTNKEGQRRWQLLPGQIFNRFEVETESSLLSVSVRSK